MRLAVGDAAPPFEAEDLTGERVRLGRPSRGFQLLSFLRYASCPMCLLRIDELVRRAPQLEAARVDLVVMLHSPRDRILRHVRPELRLRVIPDPSRRLYRLYEVETSWPRLVLSTLRPSFYARWAVATMRGYLGGVIDGEFARMPADFLIDRNGRLVLAHYGNDIGDHVRLEQVMELVGVPA